MALTYGGETFLPGKKRAIKGGKNGTTQAHLCPWADQKNVDAHLFLSAAFDRQSMASIRDRFNYEQLHQSAHSIRKSLLGSSSFHD